jgi:hypothetical protein
MAREWPKSASSRTGPWLSKLTNNGARPLTSRFSALFYQLLNPGILVALLLEHRLRNNVSFKTFRLTMKMPGAIFPIYLQ